MEIHKYAAIDIGSNAIRLLIANIIPTEDEGAMFKKSSLIRVPIRLGADAFTVGKISENNVVRMEHAMKAFSHLMTVNGIEKYRACATSAMREASNSDEILARVKKESGIDIDIIDGREEAKIIYSTQIQELLDHDKTYLYVDVGGGSTELSLFSKGKFLESESFKVGTIRLLNKSVTDDDWEGLKKWVMNVAEKYDDISLIGSGGNINKLFKMSGKKMGKPLYLDYIDSTLDYLKKFSVDERVKRLDLNVDRADVIVPATQIFHTIMRRANAEKVYVPKIGLSDGIIRKLYEDK